MIYHWFVCLKLLKKNSISSFELDPAHYLFTLGHSWNVMLRFTEANDKFLELCDAYKRTSYIIHLDANDLNGLSMMQLLSTEIPDWVWVNPKDVNLDSCSKDRLILRG